MGALFAAAVQATPTAAGMPGAPIAQTLINWLSQIALWGSLGSMLLGGAVYGLAQHSGNYNGADKGRRLAVAGLVGALITGIAPAAVNMFFDAAQSGS